MNTITLLYFGAISEICGKNNENLIFTGSVLELQKVLINKYPKLSSESYQFALNKEISSMSDEIRAGDEIALLPPFTGG
ncbi:MAG: MoaD/ThiS family protein [Bacteroidales bacterium]|nr:MoaD/ThiS family protein [Bacteroidales bacterium]